MSSAVATEEQSFPPGVLVRARRREWIVLPGSTAQMLRLRPLSGSEADMTVLSPRLEAACEPVVPATFPPPLAHQSASHESALLLRDALLMSLRRGAGPFRSFGHLAFQPRAYQLVPLLMALKQDTVRLLIADDVGIGKTIEAGMIARELLDRGDVRRFVVLCPPHLVDQWVQELEIRFHIRAVAVTASSAARLERGLPITDSIFTVHPHTVVSLDYIKSDRRRGDFATRCPELVIVDEAHTCAGNDAGRHQRHDLLRLLAQDAGRHLLLLTATPHSGDEASFHKLLGLLHPDFTALGTLMGKARDDLRLRLAGHFVQRRRQDIKEWSDEGVFPRRETADLPYSLSGAWQRYFDSVLDYCSEVVQRAGTDERRQRLNFWGTLALLRASASSPAAALQSLRTRLSTLAEDDESALRERVFDGSEDALTGDDGELPASDADPALAALIGQAESLLGAGNDPKLATLITHLERDLLGTASAPGFAPVIFCRYIATAHYLYEHLKSRFRGVTCEVVTGQLSPDEREARVAALGQHERPLLIATDCLSEGINLQEHFSAVVHYDLSWNPTRHEQREGRVDRFGQQRPLVRATLMYGRNNPVDAVVLKVILRKAKKIRDELGVPVPMPDDDHSLTQALMKAVLRERGGQTRDLFDFDDLPAAQAFEVAWTDLAERVKKNRTVFAQQTLKPEAVWPEWRKMQAALGNGGEVQRFVDRALRRLGAAPAAQGSGLQTRWRVALDRLPEDLRERLLADGMRGNIDVGYAMPPAAGARFVHRSHPLVATLAEGLLERTLADAGLAPSATETIAPTNLGRAGCWVSSAVRRQTTVLLLRLRHQITAAGTTADDEQTLVVEEACAVALHPADGSGAGAWQLVGGDEPLDWLAVAPSEALDDHARALRIDATLQHWPQWQGALEAFAHERASGLLADHLRVRSASRATGRARPQVRALLPVDVVGVFVLLPPLDM
ncbi:MAG: DEAD/DEAH box helicase [Burkholderiaceae bacterium]|nr:DEAD/DEAH box helicase [Burkholderiaceae bacterium]